jgi:MFS family permease
MIIAAPAGRFFRRFTVLRNAMPELWLVFAIKLLVIAAYQVMNVTLVLWFSSDFGLSDRSAIGLVGAWALVMSIFTVLSGSLTDALGFRKTFFLGLALSIVPRVVMIFSTNLWVALFGGLFPVAIGEALTGPVLVAATRTYSNTKQRSIAFSIIYSVMNAGFLVGNLLFDGVRKSLGEHGHFGFPGVQLTTYQVLLLVSLVIDCVVLPLIFFLREGAEATDDGVRINPKKSAHPQANLLPSAALAIRDTAKNTARIFGQLVKEPGFYRLLAFLLFIAFLKLIYRQLDYVFPKFCIRMLGDGVPSGKLLAINNIIIIFLTPVVGALTQRFAAYRMVILGGLVSAGSIFIMTLPPIWFEPFTTGLIGRWFGHGYLGLKDAVDPYYGMIAVFVIVLSFGEALYSPRVYEYAAAIAPAGQEASYSALAYVPLLVAKLLTGTFSGTLLAIYCPQQGPRHPATMWLIIGAASMIAPIGLAAFARVIRLHEAGRAD